MSETVLLAGAVACYLIGYGIGAIIWRYRTTR